MSDSNLDSTEDPSNDPSGDVEPKSEAQPEARANAQAEILPAPELPSPELPSPESPSPNLPPKARWPLAAIPVAVVSAVCVLAVVLQRPAHKNLATTTNPAATNTTTNKAAPGAAGNATSPEAPISPYLLKQPQSGASGIAPGHSATAPALPGAMAAPAVAPSSPAKPMFERGEAALAAGKLDEAKTAFEEALAADAKLAVAHLRLAGIAVAKNDGPGAIKHLETAVQLAPHDTETRLELANLYLQMRQPAKAEKAARDAVQFADSKTKRSAQGSLAQILAATGKQPAAYALWASLARANTKDAEAALASAVLAGGALKKPADAKQWLAQAARAPVSNPEVTNSVGGILARNGQLKEAERVLSEGVHKFPRFIPLNTSLAEAHMARGDAKGAIATLKAAMTRVPDSAAGGEAKGELHLALAKLYGTQKQWKSAQQEALSAAKLTPKHPAPQALLAEINFASGDAKGGIAALRRVVQLDPQNGAAHMELARALAETKQFAAAKQELDGLLKAHPKNAEMMAALAGVAEASGDKNGALAIWTSVANQVPKDPLPVFHQGRLYEALGQSDKALERYRTVLRLQPNQPHALFAAAKIEEKTGDATQAMAHLKVLVTTQPVFEGAYEPLLRIAKKQDQMPATIAFLKQQIAKQPDRRAAFAAILDDAEARGDVEGGRTFVKSYIDKFPNLAAPRAAIDAFDLRRAKKMLSDLEKRDEKSDSGRAHGSTLPTPPPDKTGTP